MRYEIWDTETANLLGSYSSEAAALAVVRATVEARGLRAVETWELAREDASEPSETIAIGTGLLDLLSPSNRRAG